MFKWISIFLTLSFSYASAQQDATIFKVIIRDDSLIKVLRKYIQIGETQGLHKDESILILNAYDLANSDKTDWYFGAINALSPQQGTKSVPAYVSELDGYPILIYLRARLDQFFSYPKAYLDYLDKEVYVRLHNKSIQRRINMANYKITFVKGKSPIVLGQL